MLRVLLTAILSGLFAGTVFAGSVRISEVLYDAAGTDQGRAFVELHGPGGMSLSGYVLEGINGVGGAITHSISLSGLLIPADGFLVLADLDSSGATAVPNFDVVLANIDLQNGPDSVRLRFGSTVADALGYGTFTGGLVFAGEGLPALDAPAGSSLARWFAGVDTDRNSVDFYVADTPTPGYEEKHAVAVPTPEPSSMLLVFCGLGLLWRSVRRYRSKQKTVPAEVAA